MDDKDKLNDKKKEITEKIDRYTKTIEKNVIDRQAYEIAKEHLGSSFCISRSNGFEEWNKDN